MFSFAERAMFTCLVLGSLVFTQSRGSMLGCLLFISMQRLGRLSSIFLILVVVIYASASDDIIRIAFSIVNSLELGDALRLESIEQLEKGSGRTIAWQFAWEEIQKNFFFGRGWSYDEIYMGGVVKQILLKLDHQGGVHNSFLIFWLNVGIVGLLLFIGSLFYLILRTSRTSPLAIPFFAGALFIANFEPWLSASLNPYTILYLMIVTLLLKEKSTGEEELA
jgi:O-antigen ligase